MRNSSRPDTRTTARTRPYAPGARSRRVRRPRGARPYLAMQPAPEPPRARPRRRHGRPAGSDPATAGHPPRPGPPGPTTAGVR
ncbi:hypothetical protein GCM10023405_30920 [Streptomonospora salina]